MDGALHKERVAQIGVGQWTSWNMDGAGHKETAAQTGVDQRPG